MIDNKNIGFLYLLLDQFFSYLKAEKQAAFSIIAWLLSVLIFIYNNKKANERESRKEIKSDIDFIIKALEDILILHEKMRKIQGATHEKPPEKNAELIEIVAKIARINTKMENMTPNPFLFIYNCNILSGFKEFFILVELSRKIGEIYDLSTRDYSEHIKDKSGSIIIWNNVLAITRKLENWFYNKYKNQRFS